MKARVRIFDDTSEKELIKFLKHALEDHFYLSPKDRKDVGLDSGGAKTFIVEISADEAA